MDTNATRIFIVEDSPAVRARLVEFLHTLGEVCIVGEADTPDAAVRGIRATQPHCVLLDLQLVGGSGLEVLRKIAPSEPDIDFIVLTNRSSQQYRRYCMDMGARWFFDKTDEFERIGDALFHHFQKH